MNPLNRILVTILEVFDETKDFTGEGQMINELCKFSEPSKQTFNQFTDYLRREFNLPPMIILSILKKLFQNTEAKNIIGRKLIIGWLKYKVYEVFDIERSKQADLRKEVSDAIDKFDFRSSGSNIEELIRVCFKAIKINVDEAEIPSLKQALLQQDKEKQIQKLFPKKAKLIQYNPDKSIEEKLTDFIADYQYFPEDSLQKVLQREQIIAFINYYSQAKQFSCMKKVSELNNETNNIKRLQDVYLNEFGSISTEMSKIFRKLASEKGPKEIYESICDIKSKVFTINVLQLERLIKKTEYAKQCIQDKDVILLIGSTGSGKSTYILKFLGYTLQAGKYAQLQTLIPVEDLQDEHQTFYTSPVAKSCTRYINAVPLPQKMYQSGTVSKNIVICDSPGFGDSAGVEVDIANGVGMIDALHEARTVRVVVVLPFDSITVDRMAGSVKMGEVISNLFNQMTVLESIAIYFNKVSPNKINEISKMIDSKINNLNPNENSNERLKQFLKYMLLKSKSDNYIDPLSTDFPLLLRKLLQMPSINNPRESFRYDFTEATKNIINKYTLELQEKVKTLYNSKKYTKSMFHLRMIQKLKEILSKNGKYENIATTYDSLIMHISQDFKKQLTQYEELVVQIITCRERSDLKYKLKQCKEKIQEIQKKFIDFEKLDIATQKNIVQINHDSKKKLLKYFEDFSNVTLQTISAVKSFSMLIDNTFQSEIMNIIKKKFNQIFAEADQQAKQKNYDQMKDNLTTLTNLVAFQFQLIQKSAINTLAEKLGELRSALDNEVKTCFSDISDLTNNQKLTQSDVKKINIRIGHINNIQDLKFLDSNKEISNKMKIQLRAIESKCRKIIRELFDMNISLNQQVQVKNGIQKNELHSRKQQIQLLMSIENLSDNLQNQYEQTKLAIAQKLKENAEILRNYIGNLNGQKNGNIKQNLETIRMATLVVMQCSKIVEDPDNIMDLTNSIQTEFIEFLERQVTAMKSIYFKLNQMNNDCFKMIKEQKEKIDSYAKMKIINKQSNQILDLANGLRDLLNQKLKDPLNEFRQRDINQLKKKNHYRHLAYFIDKFQKYSTYALNIQDILTYDEYQKIIEQNEKEIVANLAIYYEQMRIEIDQFLQNQYQRKNPPSFLKDIMKTLQTIRKKNKACDYLISRLNFDVVQKLRSIEMKLGEIHNHMAGLIGIPNSNFQDIQALLSDFKFYVEIQDLFKSKENPIGFREKQKQSQAQLKDCFTNMDDFIRSSIADKKPTNIPFPQVKYQYKKCVQKKQFDSRRRLIVSEFRKIQNNILKDLTTYNKKMSDPLFISNSAQIDGVIEAFTEAGQLRKNLYDIYTTQDKSQILISKNQIQRFGTKIINIFQEQLETVKDMLCNYNINNMKSMLKTFRDLQNMIYEIFNLEKQKEIVDLEEETLGKTEDSIEMVKLIDLNSKMLINFIQNGKSFKEDDKNKAHTARRLQALFLIIYNRVSEEIAERYGSSSSTFEIDNGFEKLFSHSNKEKRQQLKDNARLYLKSMYAQYSNKFNSSADVSEKIRQVIEEKVKFLPAQLKVQHNNNFETLRNNLISNCEQSINKYSQSIISNPDTINSYFKQAQIAKNNNQSELHRKWVNKFEQVYQQQEQTKSHLPVDKKIQFIKNSFINVFNKNKDYMKVDVQMHNVLKNKYNNWLNSLLASGEHFLISISQQLDRATHRGNGELNLAIKDLVINAFKIYIFIMKLKDDCIQDHADIRQKLKESYEIRLETVIICYKEIAQNKAIDNLHSQQMLEPARKKKLEVYIKDVTAVGETINLIKEQYQKSIHLLQPSFHLTSIKLLEQIGDYQSILIFYENQIRIMKQMVMSFQFNNHIKRNMVLNELKDDLTKLDLCYEILTSNEQFFTKEIIKQKKNQYTVAELQTLLKNKFDTYVKESEEEIVKTFKGIDGQQATKVNLILKQLGVMRSLQGKLKFISFNQVQTTYQQINKLIQSAFDKIKEQCGRNLQNAKGKFNQIYLQAQSLETKMKNEVKNENSKYKKMIDDKIDGVRKKCEEKINLEQDQNKKQEHKNAMSTEINTIKNEMGFEKDKKIKSIEDEGLRQVKIKYDSLKAPINAFALSITILQKAIIDIYDDGGKYKKYLQLVLEGLEKINPKFIKLIQSSILDNVHDQRSIGKVILTSYKAFANYSITAINKLIKGQDIKYVLKNLQKINQTSREKVNDEQLKSVQKLYNKFMVKYGWLKQNYKNTPTETTINYMITPLKDLGNIIKNEFYQNQRPIRSATNKIQLLAGIFALWVILKSETYDGTVEYTIEPHPTQITTLILLLGISHPNEVMSNRLAQVGTGEGKSIVLAGLSCYLALTGFKVRCACYSSYLSSRDQQSFRILFQKLGVENTIKYGTFNQLCEDILNNGGKNLKDEVQNMLLQPPQGFIQNFANVFGFNNISLKRGPNDIINNPTILVIDEVDVFFEDNFFGNSYCPAISLRGPAVSQFLQYVWREVQTRGKNTEAQKLINSREFKQLVDKYPSLKNLLKNQVHGMIAGALNYVHDYFIIQKRIAYKDNDSISYKINYGYKTVFAYLYEFQNNRVARPNLDQALQISLMIAEFSYAALPKYFCNILGVTGTLEVLPQYKKKQLIDRYSIYDQYFIPSAFGINKKRIEQYTLAKQQSYYKTIVEKINKVADNRPIIIFFKGPRQLNQFSNSKQNQPFLSRTYNLTEEHPASDRDNRIYCAVNPRQITLMSSAFGRGTDFVLLDDAIKEKGGLHVIHAFLSLDESQEVQIKGRTARQNNKGSYDCIISENWLEELTLTPAQIPNNATSDNIHNILLRAREERIDKLSQSTIKMLLEADRKHAKVVQIFSMQKLGQENLISYVATLNQYPEIRKVVIKTVLGLDATGSMSAALRKCCEIIGTAFEQTYAVLQKKDVKATIEVKIMVYRNYSSPCEQIIEGTTFENTPVQLKNFLNRVRPKGGQGNEALEVLFQCLNREQRIDQVILIGDAEPNTIQEVSWKRAARTEIYWKSKGFPLTHIEKEISIFKLKNCPVHSFYLNNGSGFKEISKATGGTASPFNLESKQVTENLAQFVVENILALIEKNSGKGKLNLVQTYRQMFRKRYGK